jgi:hypothetical protein
MGIARGMIKLLMREGRERKFTGNIITAGKQDVYATADDVRKWAAEMNFELNSDVDIEISSIEEFKKLKYISDVTFFKMLGFNKVDSLDYSDYQGCTILHDLNYPIPKDLEGKYELVFDGGTMEHVYDVAMVMSNFNALTKISGRIIHASPSSNHTDHGLYMFSPTFFVDYYETNKWELLETLLFEYKPSSTLGLGFLNRWKIYKYAPGSLDTWIFGGYKGMFGIFNVALKQSNSTIENKVYQGAYRKMLELKQEQNLSSPDIQKFFESKTIIQKIAFSRTILSSNVKNKIRPFYYKIANLLPLSVHLRLIARY